MKTTPVPPPSLNALRVAVAIAYRNLERLRVSGSDAELAAAARRLVEAVDLYKKVEKNS